MPTHAQRLVRAVRKKNYERLRELLEEHGDVDARTAAGRTAVHAAAEEADQTAAAILLERGADVNARMMYGRTPLHLAASYGGGWDLVDPDLDRRSPCPKKRSIDPGVAGALLEIFKAAQPSIPPELGVFDRVEGPAKMAILRTGLGAFAEPDRLLQDLLARGVDLERLAPDLAALLRGQPQFLGMARLLLDRGADTSAKDRNGATPLAGAVEKGRIEMVDLLLEHGAARVWDSSGESLVGEALGLGRLEIAELLLRHGATFDATKPGRLHTAAQGQHLPVLRWLLDRGADIDQRDEDGDTPLLTAARSGRAGAVSTLIALGADVRLRNHRGDGLLHAGGDSDCISELLRHGLPVDEPNADGRTPLHLAATVSDRAGVLALLGAGASANAGDNSGNSPLHLAFSDYEPRPDHEFPVFHALVAAGADRSTRNAEGLTAYDLAVHHQYPEEYRRLLDPVAAAPPEAFVWLGEEAYADFLPRALVRIDFDGVEWPSSEHYFHARKTADADVRERMRQAPTLAEALRRLHEKRIKAPNDWPARCGEVMRFALSEKFRQHVELRARLLATGDAVLVSDSQCDNYWYEAPGVAPFNAIGHMLMELRSKLREAG